MVRMAPGVIAPGSTTRSPTKHHQKTIELAIGLLTDIESLYKIGLESLANKPRIEDLKDIKTKIDEKSASVDRLVLINRDEQFYLDFFLASANATDAGKFHRRSWDGHDSKITNYIKKLENQE